MHRETPFCRRRATCIEKIKVIVASTDPKSKQSTAEATLKDIDEHKLKPPAHFLERLRAERCSGGSFRIERIHGRCHEWVEKTTVAASRWTLGGKS